MPGGATTQSRKESRCEVVCAADRVSGLPEDPRLERRIDSFKDQFRCNRIDAIRERISHMSDEELLQAAANVNKPGLLAAFKRLQLNNTVKHFTNDPTPENREKIIKHLSVFLTEAKNERLTRFNEMKREIMLHGTKEQMQELLDLARDEGIITTSQHDKMCRLLKSSKDGMKKAGEQFNEYLYSVSKRVESNISSARAQTGGGSTGERWAGGGNPSAAYLYMQQRPVKVDVPMLPAHCTVPFATLFSKLDPAHKSSAEVIEDCLKLTAEAVRDKKEEHKEQLIKQEELAHEAELEKIRAVLAEFPHLAGEIQMAFAELEKLPEFSLRALAVQLLKELHPNDDLSASEVPNYELPK